MNIMWDSIHDFRWILHEINEMWDIFCWVQRKYSRQKSCACMCVLICIYIFTVDKYTHINTCTLVHLSYLVLSNSVTPWIATHQASWPSPTLGACSNSCALSQWHHPTTSSCHPLLLMPSTFPSVRVFYNESILRIRWPKYYSFSINPSNEYSGLISLKMDWLDFLSFQGTLKSVLQHHSSKASIVQCSAFFIIQLTSVHDNWENHSLDLTDLCWQSNVSAFLIGCLVWAYLFLQEGSIF